ncbi:MAG: type VI secretion system baseplate subunit TssG [Ramlibacter sp.]|nr:type VI secretion system baseplate subunit TssG [Ramlibacter sp.]
MGTDERPAIRPLTERLLARPQGYNLFQAISLLERAARHMPAVGCGHGEPDAVRLKAVVSLGFQASDVSSIVEGSASGESYTLLSPVMSLAGAQGPFPLPFTELVLERKAARDHATSDFLDIFNNRFLGFLYRSRKKHHMGLNWRSPEESALAGALDALSSLGLRAGVRGPGGAAPWLRHSGLLGGAPRSMEGLLALLTDRLRIRIRGTQFVGDWRDLETEDLTRLSNTRKGGALRLGLSTVVGRRAWYQAAGIALTFVSLDLRRLRELLPGGKEHDLLKWLIARYVQQELGVSVSLEVNPAQVQPLKLTATVNDPESHASPRLGWTSWLVGERGASRQLPPARFRLSHRPFAQVR